MVIAVAALCRRFDLPAPLVLVALGAAASFLPFVPEVHLTSEVVLVGLLPPLLYAAALQTSLVDFNANRRAILLLSIGLVAFTTVGVAVVAYTVIPAVTWPAAFALGAVVAPPDAVSATAIARRIGIPRRIVTILEGESLLNDATALVALRTAIAVGGAGTAVALGGEITVLDVGLDFVLAAAGGVLVGLALYFVVGRVRRRVTDPVIDTSLSLVTPFVAYVAAEEIHGSGVLAVVVAGLLLGHKSPVLQTAGSRIAERLNWRTIQFLLENVVFLLIGLQVRWILARRAAQRRTPLRGGHPVPVHLRRRRSCSGSCGCSRPGSCWSGPAGTRRPGEHPSWQHTTVLGWAGMRGVVTLAAAFAIPEEFDYRETLILTALFVAAGTLFVQGSTLPWLVRRLRLPAPDPREDALARAALFEKALGRRAGGPRAAPRRRRPVQHGADAARPGQPAQHRGVGAARRHQPGRGDPERVLRPAAAGDARRRAGQGAARPQHRRDPARGGRGRARRARRGGVHARHPHRPPRGAPRGRDRQRHRRARSRSASTSRTAPRDAALAGGAGSARTACGTASPSGCTCASASRAATWPAATPRPAGTRAAHFEETRHPVMRSAEPGEDWRWCFVDNRLG